MAKKKFYAVRQGRKIGMFLTWDMGAKITIDSASLMNTGFRIDVAYNEETDVLTFSPNGDYIRVDTDGTPDGEEKAEQ